VGCECLCHWEQREQSRFVALGRPKEKDEVPGSHATTRDFGGQAVRECDAILSEVSQNSIARIFTRN
jgi:hypothetical protein